MTQQHFVHLKKIKRRKRREKNERQTTVPRWYVHRLENQMTNSVTIIPPKSNEKLILPTTDTTRETAWIDTSFAVLKPPSRKQHNVSKINFEARMLWIQILTWPSTSVCRLRKVILSVWDSFFSITRQNEAKTPASQAHFHNAMISCF